jgi:arylsulfatase A
MNKSSRRGFLRSLGLASASALTLTCGKPSKQTKRPNFIIIFTDDQGYADVGKYGAQGFKTPNLDRMANEGIRFTDFYVAQAVCGASRAALLTGCYPNRIGMLGAPSHKSTHGIHENELLLSELFKQNGYNTAIYGKWHLGHLPPFLPTRHGFDDYFGLPYSNDMWPFHPERPNAYPDLPLMRGEEIIDYNPSMDKLTTWYTEHAVEFIENNKNNPFFLYVAHSMPHVPLGVSNKFRGKSEQGMYGDVIMEIDWSVGQILSTLRRLDLDENTMVMFTSDNGPWLSYGDHAGSAGPLREGKGTTWDGGQREPCIMWWPGTIPAKSTCKEPVMTIDILPTWANLLKTDLPEHIIDGKDIWPLIQNKPDTKSPHDALYFYWGDELQAIRSGRWKLHFPHKYRTLAGRQGGTGGMPVKYEQGRTDLALFDLENDMRESNNVAEKYPDVVDRLKKMATEFDRSLHENQRPPAKISKDTE